MSHGCIYQWLRSTIMLSVKNKTKPNQDKKLQSKVFILLTNVKKLSSKWGEFLETSYDVQSFEKKMKKIVLQVNALYFIKYYFLLSNLYWNSFSHLSLVFIHMWSLSVSLIFINVSKLWHKEEENRPKPRIFSQNTLKSCGLDSNPRASHTSSAFH